jgi:hypothetical protein
MYLINYLKPEIHLIIYLGNEFLPLRKCSFSVKEISPFMLLKGKISKRSENRAKDKYTAGKMEFPSNL